MKKIFYVLILLLIVSPMYGQLGDSLSLFDCYRLARENAPQLSMLDLHQEKADLENKKISARNLPQVSAYGKAWYQSDAISVSFPEPIGGGMEVEQFQYNAAFTIDQVIYDGGLSKIQKELADIQSEASGFQTEAALNKLNLLVNKYFFGILGLNSTKEILNLKLEQLNERQGQLKSAEENGLVLKADLERLKAEILITNQQLVNLEHSSAKLDQSLKILIGSNEEGKILPIVPEQVTQNDSLSRPELGMFKTNKAYIDKAMQIQDRKHIPKIAAYGQLGYSYPGLNFFENQPAGFYTAGIKMSWNIFDWNVSKTEKQLLVLNKEQISIQEEEFLRNLNSELQNVKLEIQNLEKQIDIDKEIINAYESVTHSSASALDNGSITSVDYLADLNAELKARIDNKYHEIQKLEAMTRLSVLTGQVLN